MNIEQAIRDYLPDILHLSLAASKDNRPWVCEVHFAYDENLNFYFRSLPTCRHCQEIATNPYVAGSIVRQHSLTDAPVGIYFEGKARMLPAGKEQQEAYECIKERLRPPADIMKQAQDPSGCQFYKITVDTFYIFGKFGDAPTQKYTLPWGRR